VPERNLVQGKGRRSTAIESATAGMTLTRAGLNLLMHSFSLRNHKIHGMVLGRYDIVHFPAMCGGSLHFFPETNAGECWQCERGDI